MNTTTIHEMYNRTMSIEEKTDVRLTICQCLGVRVNHVPLYGS